MGGCEDVCVVQHLLPPSSDRVKDIVDTDKEIDIAVRFLHTTSKSLLLWIQYD